MIARYLREKLREPGTWATALVVGTLINAYGHVLVPWLTGETDLWGRFLREFAEAPGLMGLSVALGYVFPLLVGTWASVRTRLALSEREVLAAFPDAKPDPVFRAERDGRITAMGQGTRALFARHGVTRAAQVLGDDLWRELADQRGPSVAPVAEIRFPADGSRYLVSHAPGDDGATLVYLTRVLDGTPLSVAS